MGLGNQIEGIAHLKGGEYFVSRERLEKKIGGFNIKVPAKLFKVNVSKFVNSIDTIAPFISFLKGNSKKETFNFKRVQINNNLEEIVSIRMDSFSLMKTTLKKETYRITIKLNDRITVSEIMEIN